MSGAEVFTTLPREVLEYLRRLRAGLAPLPESEREEIVRETAAHVLDRIEAAGPAASAGAVLAELGEPEAYAARFVSNYRISSALASGSPVVLAGTALRGLGMGVWAFLGGLGLCVVYAFAVGLLVIGVVKPILPHQTGLFVGPERGGWSLCITDAASVAGSRELLGYWLVPLALAAGALLLLLAGRLARAYLRSLRR